MAPPTRRPGSGPVAAGPPRSDDIRLASIVALLTHPRRQRREARKLARETATYGTYGNAASALSPSSSGGSSLRASSADADGGAVTSSDDESDLTGDGTVVHEDVYDDDGNLIPLHERETPAERRTREAAQALALLQETIDGSAHDLVIVGFPKDDGVKRNGGRIGAAQGPASFRKQLVLRGGGSIHNAEFGVDLSAMRIADGGDVDAPTLESAHATLRLRVRGLIENGCIPFVVGGGNDQSFHNAGALLDVAFKRACAGIPSTPGGAPRKAPVGVVNVDAHLDVRPLLADGHAHSGSPFRQLLEDPRFDARKFVEFAANGAVCAFPHAQYVRDKGGRIVWYSELRQRGEGGAVAAFREVLIDLSEDGRDVFVSFDIDSIAQRDCPGVSAPATVGLSADDALGICYEAGRHPSVKIFDMSEFNPTVEEFTTSRLVVTMFYYFCLGLASRSKSVAQES